MYLRMHLHATAVKEEGAGNMNRGRRGIWGDFEEGKGRGKLFNYNLKK